MNTLTLPEEDLPFQIAKLEMGPNDVLVLRPTRPIASEASARLQAYVARVCPDRKILVIGGDIELSVLGPRKARRMVAQENPASENSSASDEVGEDQPDAQASS